MVQRSKFRAFGPALEQFREIANKLGSHKEVAAVRGLIGVPAFFIGAKSPWSVLGPLKSSGRSFVPWFGFARRRAVPSLATENSENAVIYCNSVVYSFPGVIGESVTQRI
jgi:hypothetical protein